MCTVKLHARFQIPPRSKRLIFPMILRTRCFNLFAFASKRCNRDLHRFIEITFPLRIRDRFQVLNASSIFQEITYDTADIPECRERTDLEKEYRDFPEEKLWSPSEEVDTWFSDYNVMARSVLTFVQEKQGISNEEAMENACSGYAEQYITDVLHDSDYLPEVALKKLLNKELPQKLVEKWNQQDIKTFEKGFLTYWSNFGIIQRKLLPHKNVEDIVEFYYVWKRTEAGRKLKRSCTRRPRRFTMRRISAELSSISKTENILQNAAKLPPKRRGKKNTKGVRKTRPTQKKHTRAKKCSTNKRLTTKRANKT